jgi:hypothetical protein
MFEFLLLTSFALIIFSQQLPTEKQKNNKPARTDTDNQVKPKKSRKPCPKKSLHKKQPRRKIFNRAA